MSRSNLTAPELLARALRVRALADAPTHVQGGTMLKEIAEEYERAAKAAAQDHSSLRGNDHMPGGKPNAERRKAFLAAAAPVNAQAADKRAAGLAAVIRTLLSARIKSPSRIAGELNARGYPALWGGTWTTSQVTRLLHQLEGKEDSK